MLCVAGSMDYFCAEGRFMWLGLQISVNAYFYVEVMQLFVLCIVGLMDYFGGKEI